VRLVIAGPPPRDEREDLLGQRVAPVGIVPAEGEEGPDLPVDHLTQVVEASVLPMRMPLFRVQSL
jgi:hypothetical protein